MTTLKYEKYFMKKSNIMAAGDTTLLKKKLSDKFEVPKLHHVLGINRMRVEGAITMNCSWLFAGEDPGKMDVHTHPYPEIIGFMGSNPDNLDDLGAEAEIWMGDEKYVITDTFMVYVPAKLKHCPLIVRNIRSNVLHFDLQLTTGDFTADWSK